jgi:hypothetical protein
VGDHWGVRLVVVGDHWMVRLVVVGDHWGVHLVALQSRVTYSVEKIDLMVERWRDDFLVKKHR